jgi:hypothetical protein
MERHPASNEDRCSFGKALRDRCERCLARSNPLARLVHAQEISRYAAMAVNTTGRV